MKFLPGLLLVAFAPLTAPNSALAQAVPAGAASLQTQPASLNQSNASPIGAPLPNRDLNGVSASLRAKPQPPAKRPLIPESFTQPRKPPTIDPLEYFKVPPLDGGIKVRIGG